MTSLIVALLTACIATFMDWRLNPSGLFHASVAAGAVAVHDGPHLFGEIDRFSAAGMCQPESKNEQ